MKDGDLERFPSTRGPDPIGVIIGFNHFEQRAKVYWPEVGYADWEPMKWSHVVSKS